MNQRERKKRTVKAETAAKTVPTAKEIKTEKTVSAVKEKKAVKPDTQGIFDNRMASKIDELRWLIHGALWKALCLQNYAVSFRRFTRSVQIL